VFSFLGGLFVLFFVSVHYFCDVISLTLAMQVPETKGLSLEEMDEAFGAEGLAASDLQRHAEISQRIGLAAYDSGSPAEKYDDDITKA
jgi:hypothetical protein